VQQKCAKRNWSQVRLVHFFSDQLATSAPKGEGLTRVRKISPPGKSAEVKVEQGMCDLRQQAC
jgi:hypothetical protein